MGQGQSIVKDDVPHVWIQEPSPWHIFVPRVHFYNRPVPAGLDDGAIDEILWKSISSELDPHVYGLNVGMRYLMVAYIFILVLVGIFMSLWSTFGKKRNDDNPVIFFLPFVAVFLAAYFSIIGKNLKADAEIGKICESFGQRFRLRGFGIEYRTEWTGWCKPKRARPARAIVFPPIPEFEKGPQFDNSPYVL